MSEQNWEPDINIEWRTTLSELQMILGDPNQKIPGDLRQTIQEAVEKAEQEVQRRGVLSQGTADELETLLRPFKSGQR